MPIVWHSTPPRRTLRSDIGLLAIEARENVVVRLLGPAKWLETHWHNGRTIACLGSEECRVHTCPVTWKGFAPVLASNRSWRGKVKGTHLGVLVVTEEIGEAVAACAIGTVAEISRAGAAANSPLSMCLAARQPSNAAPEGFDVVPYVMRAMGLAKHFACKLKIAT